MRSVVLTLLLLVCKDGETYELPVRPIYEWTSIDYQYPSPEARAEAIASKKFIPGNARVIDVDLYDDDFQRKRIFITTPLFTSGIPATLSVITNNANIKPPLAPYPSWDWHQDVNSCKPNRIVSVFRVQIDECGRLWVLDTGSASFVQICPPQILAFNLTTNTLIHRYEIPANQIQSNSLLTAPVVDLRNLKTCANTFVYAADTRTSSIIVHDVDKNTSWTVSDKTMSAVPDFGTVCITGFQFELMDGIQGMALSPYKEGEDRVLFYHAFSSNTEQWVRTSKLQNKTRNPNDFHLYCGRRKSQASPMAIDQNGVAYFGQAFDTSLNCWNINTAYGDKNIQTLYQNRNTLHYINGLKVIKRKFGRPEELWFINTNVKRVVNGPANSNEINFRVQQASISGFPGCKVNKRAEQCIEPFPYCRNCFNCVTED